MDLKTLFLRDATTREHLEAQRDRYFEYVPLLLLLFKNQIDISGPQKGRVLAAAFARKDVALYQHLLSLRELFGLPEVLKALTILDSSRRKRALEKRLVRLEQQGVTSARKLGALRSKINDLSQDENIGSVSGALSRHVRRWLRTFTQEQLRYFALNMPKEPWMELADLVHPNPKDFQLDWFLANAFGTPPPSATAPPPTTDSAAAETAQVSTGPAPETTESSSSASPSAALALETMNPQQILELLRRDHVPYSFLRKHAQLLNGDMRVEIVKYETLETVMWYYEELTESMPDEISKQINKTIEERLKAGEEPQSFSYGKLTDRLLLFRSLGASFYHLLLPIAERRLKSLSLRLDPPVAVLGDASSSMDVAIRVANILGSVLAVLTDAELSYFSAWLRKSPRQPHSVEDVLFLADEVRASGSTSPAAALWPYLEHRRVLKFLIVVTDEEENTNCQGMNFAQMFDRYRNEVSPNCKLVFVSFLAPTATGEMVSVLRRSNIPCIQFRLDSKRPDLTRLDALLGTMGCETEDFSKQIAQLGAVLREKDLSGLVAHMATST